MFIFVEINYFMSSKTTNISITIPKDILDNVNTFVSNNKKSKKLTRSKWFVIAIENEMKKQ